MLFQCRLMLIAVIMAEAHKTIHLRNGLGPRSGAAIQAENSYNVASGTSALKSKYPWYHTSREIFAEVQRLAAKCHNALSYRTETDSNVVIDVVRLRLPGTSPVNRVFILFGEHSRELISPESGLHFLRMLCGDAPSNAIPGSSILRDNEFVMVLNGNPRSRAHVEHGEFCLRANPNGVDLNRNWDAKWDANLDDWETDPGKTPFSEPETRIFKELVSNFQPTTFLTVHSGTLGVYMPWAYDTKHLGTRNQKSMLNILQDIDKIHCQCPYGAAGKEVGYACPGTCVDYAYDVLRTPYVFAFEIWGNPSETYWLRKRWEQEVRSGTVSVLQNGGHLGHKNFAGLFQRHVSDFVHVSGTKHNSTRDASSCFSDFNPDTKALYQETVQNWASAYLLMCQLVVADMQNQRSANSTIFGAAGSQHKDAIVRQSWPLNALDSF